MTEHELTRRRLLALGLALPPLAALAGSDLFAGELLAATPAIADDDDPTPAQTEGPYFTPNSPLRRSIVPARAAGTRLTLTGRVLTTAGKPVARALVDFWQADASGAYDNSGYRFRGHQFTDPNGRVCADDGRPRPLPRTHEAHPRQGAGARPTHPDHAAVLPRRRAQPRRLDLPVRAPRPELAQGRERRAARFDFVLDV